MPNFLTLATDIRNLPYPESLRSKLLTYSMFEGLSENEQLIEKNDSKTKILEIDSITQRTKKSIDEFIEKETYFSDLKKAVFGTIENGWNRNHPGEILPIMYKQITLGNPEDKLRRMGIWIFEGLDTLNLSHYSETQQKEKQHEYLIQKLNKFRR